MQNTKDTDWVAVVAQLRQDGLSWTQIARHMMPVFPGLTEIQVREKCRTAIPRPSKHRKAITTEGKPKLVFADPHVPFDHPGYLDFLVDTYAKYNCGMVISLGDQTDQHVFSRFTKEAIAQGAIEEYYAARERTQQYLTAFKTGKMTKSNHDDRYIKLAARNGLPELFLKSFAELYGVPAGWEISDEFVIDDVLYKHGEGCGGADGALKAAQRNGMSICIGHFHTLAGVKYYANPRELWFGMNVGSGIDRQAYAFAYGIHHKDKPILGCGIVYDSSHAEFVPMGARYFRHGKGETA